MCPFLSDFFSRGVEKSLSYDSANGLNFVDHILFVQKHNSPSKFNFVSSFDVKFFKDFFIWRQPLKKKNLKSKKNPNLAEKIKMKLLDLTKKDE